MNQELQARKDLLSPPGDTIQETIDVLGMTQAELAERMGKSTVKLNEIIKGKEPVSTKTALLLERVLGIPMSFWMNREIEYREELARIEQEEALVSHTGWVRNFPVSELKQRKLIQNTNERITNINDLLGFFSVASPVEWEKIYLGQEVSVAFRISLANLSNPYSISAWLRIGELELNKMALPPYNNKLFKKTLLKIKELVVCQPNDFQDRLKGYCFSCGVGVVYTSCLPKAPISGATRWVNGKPLVQLSGRYKTNDQFWFSFFHEAGHILNHGKKDIFLEDVKGGPVNEVKEKQADDFASEFLFPQKAINELLEYPMLDDNLIIQFSERYKTHPAVIIGQLQHRNLIKFNQGNHFKVNITLVD